MQRAGPPIPNVVYFANGSSNFIFDESMTSKDCANQRKHKRNRDEKNMVADIVKDSEPVESSTDGNPWGKIR